MGRVVSLLVAGALGAAGATVVGEALADQLVYEDRVEIVLAGAQMDALRGSLNQHAAGLLWDNVTCQVMHGNVNGQPGELLGCQFFGFRQANSLADIPEGERRVKRKK